MTLEQRKRTCPYFKAFIEQRENAARRGIEWQFTFDEWKQLWESSGCWEKRGKGADRYVMARHGDTGPYSPSNVRITTFLENGRDARVGKPGHNPWGRKGKPVLEAAV